MEYNQNPFDLATVTLKIKNNDFSAQLFSLKILSLKAEDIEETYFDLDVL